MVDREMRFYLGEWVPLYDVNDKESEELKAKLLEKDIKLNEQGKWILTGGTLDEVMNKIYLSKINLAMYVGVPAYWNEVPYIHSIGSLYP